MRCDEVTKYMFLVIDGEIEPSKAVEIQQHIEECSYCKTRFVFEESLKQKLSILKYNIKAPATLKTVIQKRIQREDQILKLKRIVPLALAASLVLILGTLFYNYYKEIRDNFREVYDENLIEDLVSWHTYKVPVEVEGANVEKVTNWLSQSSELPLQIPRFTLVKASLEGARIVSIRPYPSLYLSYRLHGKKVSLMIFKRDRLPHMNLRKIHLNDKDLYYTTFNNINVLIWNKGDISYAISSELALEELVSLVEMLSEGN